MFSRHLLRSIAMQSLYEWDFRHRKVNLQEILNRNLNNFADEAIKSNNLAQKIIDGVKNNISQIDLIIQKAAPSWPIKKMNILDRNILRIGVYELILEKDDPTPPKAIINEAIELAKSFSSDNSSKFVNGILGTIYQEIKNIKNQENSHYELQE